MKLARFGITQKCGFRAMKEPTFKSRRLRKLITTIDSFGRIMMAIRSSSTRTVT